MGEKAIPFLMLAIVLYVSRGAFAGLWKDDKLSLILILLAGFCFFIH